MGDNPIIIYPPHDQGNDPLLFLGSAKLLLLLLFINDDVLTTAGGGGVPTTTGIVQSGDWRAKMLSELNILTCVSTTCLSTFCHCHYFLYNLCTVCCIQNRTQIVFLSFPLLLCLKLVAVASRLSPPWPTEGAGTTFHARPPSSLWVDPKHLIASNL